MASRREKRVLVKYGTSYSIWFAVIILCMFGLLVQYSASGSVDLFKKQLIFAGAGLVICFIFQFVHYKLFYRISGLIYIIGVICIFLLLTDLGISKKGATRWLGMEKTPFQFQVAELVKPCVIIMLAYMIQRFARYLHKGKLLIYLWILGFGAGGLLLYISNDLSSSVVVLGITFGITYIYTKKWMWMPHVGIIIVGVVFVSVYVYGIWRDMPTPEELDDLPFRVGRIAAWIDPNRYADDQGYQVLQSLYAIGSGGIWGKGLGNSVQKLSAIPEAENDMIFSILCEELGLFGGGLLLCLIAYLLWLLYQTAIHANTLFGSVLCTGVFLHIALQSIINIAVNVNLFPNTGIGLPFVSAGGTALLGLMAEIAMALSVARISEGKAVLTGVLPRKKNERFTIRMVRPVSNVE